MSGITFNCPKCRTPLEASPDLIQQAVICPNCNTKIAPPAPPKPAALASTQRLARAALIVSVLCAVVSAGTLSIIVWHLTRTRALPLNTNPDHRVAGLEKQFAEMGTAIFDTDMRLELLRTDVTNMHTELNQLDLNLWFHKYTTDRSTATLDPANPGPFTAVENDTGLFFVSLKEVQQYLSGVKVTFHLGNPMNCSFTGASLEVTFGEALDKNRVSEDGYIEAHKKRLQKKIVKITDTLEAGRWNPVTVYLAPIAPSELGTLEVKIETSSLELLRPLTSQWEN